MTKEQKKRLASIRAIAPLNTSAVPPRPVSQPTENGSTSGLSAATPTGDEKPPENLPQVSRASHYS